MRRRIIENSVILAAIFIGLCLSRAGSGAIQEAIGNDGLTGYVHFVVGMMVAAFLDGFQRRKP